LLFEGDLHFSDPFHYPAHTSAPRRMQTAEDVERINYSQHRPIQRRIIWMARKKGGKKEVKK
jgi:hypothetical protein